MKNNIPALIMILLLSSYIPLFGQERLMATIEFASGDDVLVIRSGRRLNFPDPFGLELLEGDQVQTGRGVFVELRLRSGGAVIKLAENTTFMLERMANGETALSLVYGRVRAKVDKLAGTDTFTIRSATSVAGVRGTDFGVDVLARQQASASLNLTRTYVFDGSVTVTALLRSSPLAAEGLEPVPREYTLQAGEMVVVSRVDTVTEAEKSGIETEIMKFWSTNDFSTIDAPSLLTLPKSQETSMARSDMGELKDITATPMLSDATKESLDEAFKRGYSTGYPAGFDAAMATVPKEPSPQEYVLPEGLLSLEESRRIKQALTLQKGGVIAGSILITAAAGLAGGAIWQMESGDTDKSMDNFRLAVIISVSSLPFFFAALAVRP
jgi:hypothetical protein